MAKNSTKIASGNLPARNAEAFWHAPSFPVYKSVKAIAQSNI